MAHSPSSAERRAHLIREMAKQSDLARTRSSAPSSIASEEPPHAFDTESQQLPALPPHPATDPRRLNADPGFKINTSVLRRAFPDFSQYGSSGEDSIELGRGGHRSLKSSPSRQALSEDITKDVSFDLGDGYRYRVTATPPAKPRRKSPLDANKPQVKPREGLGKENQDPAPGKTTAYGSGSTSPVDDHKRSQRAPLAELNAQVDTENSIAFSDGREKAPGIKKRSSRFANNVHARINTTPKGKGLESAIQNGTITSAQSAANGTYQSFLLPDLPNITELVSGVRHDGTPLFPGSSKSKSRFTASTRQRSQQLPTYMPLGSAPIPADEKALYASLQLLQEKIATLEEEKKAADKRADEYELELLQLRSQIEGQDILLDQNQEFTQDGEDNKTKDWDTEKSKLEQSIKSLQSRLNKANKKVSASEVTIKNLTKDRDAAHQQLAVAYMNSEELKTEANSVRDEIKNVKSQLVKVTKKHEKKIERLTKEENELRAKIQRREKAVNEMSVLTKDLWETRHILETQNKEDTVMTNRPLSRRSRPASAVPIIERSDSQPNLQKYQDDSVRVANPESRSHKRATSNVENIKHVQAQGEELSKDSDFLSFMDGDEVSKLRRIVEQDKDKLQKIGQFNTVTGSRVPTKPAFKSVLKSRNDDPLTEDLTNGQQTTRETLTGRYTSRRRSNADLTSAIILPDITLQGRSLNMMQNKDGKDKILVRRPIPVSERPLEAGVEGDEPTMRPANSPAVALATVLQGLEDEIAQLKKQLSQLEQVYNQHEPALSKRKRNSVFEKMQRCLNLIEVKADQVYALYDVLEGQKATGQTMREEEVELTLRDIGIDVEAAKFSTRNPTPIHDLDDLDEHSQGSDDPLDDEDDDELPWEGIDTTGTHTLGSLKNAVRSSAR